MILVLLNQNPSAQTNQRRKEPSLIYRPTCFSSSPSSVAERQAWMQLSTERSTSFPASMSCSWHTGELMVGLTTCRCYIRVLVNEAFFPTSSAESRSASTIND